MTHKRGQTDRVLFVNSDFCRRGVRIRRFWEVATEPGAETGSRRAEIVILGAGLVLTPMAWTRGSAPQTGSQNQRAGAAERLTGRLRTGAGMVSPGLSAAHRIRFSSSGVAFLRLLSRVRAHRDRRGRNRRNPASRRPRRPPPSPDFAPAGPLAARCCQWHRRPARR